jgi:hypothetical protein
LIRIYGLVGDFIRSPISSLKYIQQTYRGSVTTCTDDSILPVSRHQWRRCAMLCVMALIAVAVYNCLIIFIQI